MKALMVGALVLWLAPAAALLAWVYVEYRRDLAAEERARREWAEFVAAHQWEGVS